MCLPYVLPQWIGFGHIKLQTAVMMNGFAISPYLAMTVVAGMAADFLKHRRWWFAWTVWPGIAMSAVLLMAMSIESVIHPDAQNGIVFFFGPLALIVPALGASIIGFAIGSLRTRSSERTGQGPWCSGCNYELHGLTAPSHCPECGREFEAS